MSVNSYVPSSSASLTRTEIAELTLLYNIRNLYDYSNKKSLFSYGWEQSGNYYPGIYYATGTLSPMPNTDNSLVYTKDTGISYANLGDNACLYLPYIKLWEYLRSHSELNCIAVQIGKPTSDIGNEEFYNIVNNPIYYKVYEKNALPTFMRDYVIPDLGSNRPSIYTGTPNRIKRNYKPYGFGVVTRNNGLSYTAICDLFRGTGWDTWYASTTSLTASETTRYFRYQINPSASTTIKQGQTNFNIVLGESESNGNINPKWALPCVELVQLRARWQNALNIQVSNDISAISAGGSVTDYKSKGQPYNKQWYTNINNNNTSDVTPEQPSINTALTCDIVTLYNPTVTALKDISSNLWSTTFIDKVKRLYNDPREAIISLHLVPFQPTDEGSAADVYVAGAKVGDIPSAYLKKINETIECGTIHIDPYFGNFLDYSATKLSVYLPFCGSVDLDPKQCIGSDIKLTYECNCLTGEVLAKIQLTRSAENSPDGIALKNVIYQKEGNCIFSIPLSSASYDNRIKAILGAIATTAGGVVSAATGGAGFSAALITRGVTRGIDALTSSPQYSYKMSSGNYGFMGIRTPFIEINRPVTLYPINYDAHFGYPCVVGGVVGDFSGYTEIADVHLDYVNCLGDEKEEIERLLKTGVIL